MKTILSIVTVLISSTCFAHNANEDWTDELISAIAANESTCVHHYENEKTYINPERIYPTAQGNYLNLNDNEFILLPYLNSDSHGCYLKNRHPEVLNYCPDCGRKYFVSCDNPDCPSKQRKEERKEREKREKEERKEKKNKRGKE